MRIFYYENYKEDLRIFVDRKEDYEGYFLGLGKESPGIPFSLSKEDINQVPFDDKRVKEFLEHIENSNPLMIKKIAGRESELILALREVNRTIIEEERKKSRFS